MTHDQAPITRAHVADMRRFLYALGDEAQNGAPRAASRAVTVLFSTLTAASIGYLDRSLEHEDQWTEADARHWWLLLQIARTYRAHPDLPASIQPFLDDLEWR